MHVNIDEAGNNRLMLQVETQIAGRRGRSFGNDIEDGGFQAAGFFGSIIGAIIALLIYRAVTSRRGAGAGGMARRI